MKSEWIEYMKSIGLTEPILQRAEQVLLFFQETHPGTIQEIFVTEYVEEGNRQYESLWLFSNTAAMEAKRFLQEDDFDFTLLANRVRYWTIKKTEYNFKQASPQSRMTLSVSLDYGITCTLRASQQNCDHLKEIFLRHIIGNTA